MAKNLNIQTTVEAWADIVIKNWQQKIVQLKIHGTGALYESFVADVLPHAGDVPERVDFSYEYYGMFVEMGVGKGVYFGDKSSKRKPKPWKSKMLFGQTSQLTKILANKYAIKSAALIRDHIEQNELNTKT